MKLSTAKSKTPHPIQSPIPPRTPAMVPILSPTSQPPQTAPARGRRIKSGIKTAARQTFGDMLSSFLNSKTGNDSQIIPTKRENQDAGGQKLTVSHKHSFSHLFLRVALGKLFSRLRFLPKNKHTRKVCRGVSGWGEEKPRLRKGKAGGRRSQISQSDGTIWAVSIAIAHTIPLKAKKVTKPTPIPHPVPNRDAAVSPTQTGIPKRAKTPRIPRTRLRFMIFSFP